MSELETAILLFLSFLLYKTSNKYTKKQMSSKPRSPYWLLPIIAVIGVGIILTVTLVVVDNDNSTARLSDITTAPSATTVASATSGSTPTPSPCPVIRTLTTTNSSLAVLFSGGYYINETEYSFSGTVTASVLPTIITSYIASNYPSLQRPYEVTAATETYLIIRDVPILFDVHNGVVGMIPSGVMTGFALKGGFLYTIENGVYLLKLNPTTGSLYSSIAVTGAGFTTLAHSAEDDLIYTGLLSSLNVVTGATTATSCTVNSPYKTIAFDVDNHLWVY